MKDSASVHANFGRTKMGYLTYRVEITRDEVHASAAPNVEITAYIDRVPETDAPEFGRLSRASKGVWNSRLQYTGDFESLAAALAAIDASYPQTHSIRCYEWSIDDEVPVEKAILRRSDGKWSPADPPST